MMKFGLAALFAASLFVGCASDTHHRYSDTRDYRSACTAPAVGLCAGCEISCSRHDEAYCEPGHSTPAQGTVAGYCSDEARCVCRD
jgi:hypothetical protein